MKFKVGQEELANGLQLVQRAAATRSAIPLLSGVLIETTADGLALTATDQELGVRVIVPAEVAAEGAFVFPGRVGDIVRKIPFGEIAVEVSAGANTSEITWQRSRFVIHGYPPSDFPSLPEPPSNGCVAASKSVLRRLIRQTAFAVSHDDSRPVFTGTLMTLGGQTLRLVATDGFRLALADGEIAGDAGEWARDVIVPGRALNEVARVLGDEGDGKVEICLQENRVFFGTARERVVCRLIEGQFPPYKQVVPQQFVTTLKCETQALLDACERAALIARDVGQAIKLQISGTTLVVSASTPELGNMREEVAIESQGDALEIAFNPRYLVDGLRNIDAERMSHEFTGPLSPSCIRPDGEERDSFAYVVLPMRLA